MFLGLSRKGNDLDHSLMETFFGILTQKMYHGKTFKTYEGLKVAIETYSYYSNYKRIQTKLAGRNPV